MIKSLYNLWNKNFNKGVTIFQMFLMVSIVIGAIQSNQFLILFSTGMSLFVYLEPNENRFSFGGKD